MEESKIKTAKEILDKHYETYRNLERNPSIPFDGKQMILEAMQEYAAQFQSEQQTPKEALEKILAMQADITLMDLSPLEMLVRINEVIHQSLNQSKP